MRRLLLWLALNAVCSLCLSGCGHDSGSAETDSGPPVDPLETETDTNDTASVDLETDDPVSTDDTSEPIDTGFADCPISYELVILDTVGWDASTSHGLNNAGWAVGEATASLSRLPLVWEPGIGTAPGGTFTEFASELPVEEFFATEIRDINDSGAIIGWGVQTPDPFSGGQGVNFYWSEAAGTRRDLCPGTSCQAEAINNLDVVVGMSVSSGEGRPFIWSEAAGGALLPPYPRPEMFSAEAALAINDGGQVVGSLLGSRGFQAFRWSEEAGYTVLPDLDSTALINTTPRSINSHGQVVGSSRLRDTTSGVSFHRPVLWEPDGTLLELGLLDDPPGLEGGTAVAINDSGFVVGMDERRFIVPDEAWLWCGPGSQKKRLAELLSPEQAAEWSIAYLSDLNNHGAIVGSAVRQGDFFGTAVALVPSF